MSPITSSTRRSAVLLTLAVLAAAGCGSPSGLSDGDICAGSPRAARLQVTPDSLNLPVGSTETIQLEMHDTNGEVMFMCGPAVTWSSSDRSIATVSGGYVSGIRAGKAIIQATGGGLSDSTVVSVVVAATGSVSMRSQ